MSIFGGGGGKTQATSTSHETALNVQSSSAGKVVSVVLGTKRIAGNLLWYGDFAAISHESTSSGGGKGGGGGKSQTSTTYTYQASTIVGLCWGPIRGIGKVWSGDDVVSMGALGSVVTVAAGNAAQAPWSWLQAAHPDQAIGYSRQAYVGIAAADLGSSATLINWNWEVRGFGTPVNNDGTGSYDISMAEAIRLIIEDADWGASLTGVLGDLAEYQAWCAAHGFVCSHALSEAKSARDIVGDYLTATLAEAVWSGERIRIVPYADQPVGSYVPDLDPILIIDMSMLLPGENDEGPIKVTSRDPAEAFNYVSVEYHDRSNDYNTATVTALDLAHIATYGQRPGPSISAHFFSTAATAQHAADLVQAREIGADATFEFGLGPIGALLEPMDIVWLPEDGQGLANYPVRIKKIDEGGDHTFQITAEKVPGCVGAMVSRVVAIGNGHRARYNESPALCNEPIIFEAPYSLTSSPSRQEAWIAVSGSAEDWGGCEVWISRDNETYARAGSIAGTSRTGRLSATFSGGEDPDLVNVLSVDLSESRGTLLPGTQDDADSATTLCWVDGEFVSYEMADLAATHAYNLSYLRRGLYGSDRVAHLAGRRFARLDGNVFKYPFTVADIGRTIYVKCLGFNQYGGGIQSLADVVAYPYTVTGRALPPAPSAFYRVGDKAVWTVIDPPDDFVGVRLRHLAGNSRNWEQGQDWPADGAVVTAREIDLAQFGAGTRTLMARSVDSTGNLSIAAVYLTIGLGDVAPANVIITYDLAAEEFPGEIVAASVIDGTLVADDTGDLLLPDKAALLLPAGSDLLLPVAYEVASYAFSYVPAATDVPGDLRLSSEISGEGWQVQYRRRGSLALLLPRDDQALLPDGASLLLGGPEPWSVWPGILAVLHEHVDFRVVLQGGQTPGRISALSLSIDVPDIVESFEDVVIPAGGGRLPITKTYRAIDYVGSITLQDDGHGAVQLLRLDLNPALGPLLKAVDGAGNSVQATIDVQNMKGH